jgi:PPIC-type PPIASE domain
MERQRTIGLGALFVIVVAVAAIWARIPHPPAPEAAATAAPAASSAATVAAPAPTPSAVATLEAAVENALTPEEATSEGFDLLPDGRRAPHVPDSAPQQVTFGVVVFAYQGSQFAPPNARTKDEAKQKALAAAAEAKHDFAAAVARGDHGSTSNAGRMPRGILEGAAEYVLFSLAKGEVAAEPVDTPRGYWILRRID